MNTEGAVRWHPVRAGEHTRARESRRRRCTCMATSVQAFTLACEFMYTAEIEELEDAEVAINVWMVASALVIRDLPRYVHAKVLQLLPAAHLHLVPGLFRQALAAWHLCRSSRPDMEEEGASIMQAVMELIMCKLQVRQGRPPDPATSARGLVPTCMEQICPGPCSSFPTCFVTWVLQELACATAIPTVDVICERYAKALAGASLDDLTHPQAQLPLCGLLLQGARELAIAGCPAPVRHAFGCSCTRHSNTLCTLLVAQAHSIAAGDDSALGAA